MTKSKAPTITQVRRLHDAYAKYKARYGENDMGCGRHGMAFYEAKDAYEAATGKTYEARGRR